MQSRHTINNCTVNKCWSDNECSAWIRKVLRWTESRDRSQGEGKVAERDVLEPEEGERSATACQAGPWQTLSWV